MRLQLNIFNKVIIFIFVLLIPIIALYSYSNYVSVRVVKTELKNTSLEHLSKLMDRIDATVNQMSNLSITLLRDPNIKEFENIHLYPNFYDRNKIKSTILDKINIESIGYNWTNDLTIYSLPSDDVISTNRNQFNYDHEYFYENFTANWTYRKQDSKNEGVHIIQDIFVRNFVEPASAYKQIRQAKVIFEVSFSTHNMIQELNEHKEGGQGDPFFYHPKFGLILNHTADTETIHTLIKKLNHSIPDSKGNRTIMIDGDNYLINMIKSTSLDWYLIDYLPLEHVLMPITTSRNLFYISIFLLLILSIIASYLLYRHVQVPIYLLIQNVKKINRGDFSSRIIYKENNEFSFLIERFNGMAEQIQKLIEKVYIEKLRSREATLKQLQSQINPHFLYNCLFFIKNMARLGEEEAVVKMSLHLGEYYQYTTRSEKQTATIREEVQSVTNYLVIQKLRMDKIQYDINIPKEILEISIPRLMLQPIVENAIIHGLEPKPEAGRIKIYGEQDDRQYKIIVEDDGVGMTDESLKTLKRKIWLPLDEEMGCGMWNVHQRLILHFNKKANTHINSMDSGGLQIVLSWEK